MRLLMIINNNYDKNYTISEVVKNNETVRKKFVRKCWLCIRANKNKIINDYKYDTCFILPLPKNDQWYSNKKTCY